MKSGVYEIPIVDAQKSISSTQLLLSAIRELMEVYKAEPDETKRERLEAILNSMLTASEGIVKANAATGTGTATGTSSATATGSVGGGADDKNG